MVYREDRQVRSHGVASARPAASCEVRALPRARNRPTAERHGRVLQMSTKEADGRFPRDPAQGMAHAARDYPQVGVLRLPLPSVHVLREAPRLCGASQRHSCGQILVRAVQVPTMRRWLRNTTSAALQKSRASHATVDLFHMHCEPHCTNQAGARHSAEA